MPLPDIYKMYVLPGLEEVLNAIPSIRHAALGMPSSIQTAPVISHSFVRRTEEQTGQIIALRYQTLHTIYIHWQDMQQAEQQIADHVDVISSALFANPTLGGRIGHGGCDGICAGGLARVIEQVHRYVQVGGQTKTVIDATSEVLVKIGVSFVRPLANPET